MTERYRKTLIKRYLDNKATLKELEVFFSELEDPQFIKLLEQGSEKLAPTKQILNRKRIISAAAAILLISFSFWYLMGNFEREINFKTANNHPKKANTDIIVEFEGKRTAITSSENPNLVIDSIVKTSLVDTIRIIMPFAKSDSFFLPDGTKVHLNANSTLIFPTTYRSGQRWADLNGEAFFEVKSDKAHPFYVNTISNPNKIQITVTGTKFNVSSYPNETYPQVSLFEGHVEVNNNKLETGQQFIRAKEGDKILTFNPDKVGGWLTGKFVFDDDKISTIISELENWYGVQFEVREISDEIHFGGTISKSRDLNSTLKILSKHAPVRFERLDNKIVVLPTK